MKAIEELMKEHRGIEVMLRVLEAISRQAEASEPLNPKDLDEIVEFLTIFAEKCHHGKEEDLLIPAMEAAGIPRDGGPIGHMLAEHAEGRRIIRRFTAALDEYQAGKNSASSEIASAAKDYVKLLSQHIKKEDEVLYPLVEKRFNAENDKKLVEAFEELEQKRIGPGKHEEFHKLLQYLEKKYLER